MRDERGDYLPPCNNVSFVCLAFVGQVQNEDDNGSFWLGSIVGIRGEEKRGTLVK